MGKKEVREEFFKENATPGWVGRGSGKERAEPWQGICLPDSGPCKRE
jgi:hypothetical protein